MTTTYKIKSNQSVSDLVMATYGDLSYAYKLISDNPQISNINADLSSLVSREIIFTPVNKTSPLAIQPKTTIVDSNLLTYSSRDGQNINDICLQVYGTLNLVYKLMQDNNWKDINTYPPAGTRFNYLATLIYNPQFKSYLSKNKIHINTGTIPDDSKYLLQEDGFDFLLEDDTGKIKLE